MHRHPALQPFSRDHHLALILARRLQTAVAAVETERHATLTDFLHAWRQTIAPHLEREESLLLPLLERDDGERLTAEHAELHRLVAELAGGATHVEVWQRCGELLHDHVRWEEREVFPRLQDRAGPQLDALASHEDHPR